MKQTVEEAAKEAIHKRYNCNGKYPCSEREYCIHCSGCNSAFDCNECGADEYKAGFIDGVEWARKNQAKPKTMCLIDKTKVCNQCHECDVDILNPSY